MNDTEKQLTALVKQILIQEHKRGLNVLKRVSDRLTEELDEAKYDTPCEINDGYIQGLDRALSFVTASIITYETLNKGIINDYERTMNHD